MEETEDSKDESKPNKIVPKHKTVKSQSINKQQDQELQYTYSQEILDENSELVHGAKLEVNNAKPNRNLVIKTLDTKFYDVINKKTEVADSVTSETRIRDQRV